MPDTYQYFSKRGEPRWTHQQTGLYVALVRRHTVPQGKMTHATARTPDDRVWTFEVRPGGSDSYAEVQRELGGSREAAVATALEWLADHRGGTYDGE